MGVTDHEREQEPIPFEEDDTCSSVTAHGSSPDRTVFTEEGNTDGWIATDYTVELAQ